MYLLHENTCLFAMSVQCLDLHTLYMSPVLCVQCTFYMHQQSHTHTHTQKHKQKNTHKHAHLYERKTHKQTHIIRHKHTNLQKLAPKDKHTTYFSNVPIQNKFKVRG